MPWANSRGSRLSLAVVSMGRAVRLTRDGGKDQLGGPASKRYTRMKKCINSRKVDSEGDSDIPDDSDPSDDIRQKRSPSLW